MDMLEKAHERQARRVKTKPSRPAKAKRVDSKVARGSIKKARSKVRPDKGIGGSNMFSFDINSDTPKTKLYADLTAAAKAVTADERDAIANMANASALVWQILP